ncbi:uncharacterized protein DNG_01525 [Cephalotrichum gorgonifer]|uniref:Uncharacterized protein n=1 Tax=Cephalotrichum gorgonifer TaxID=2041049 RepID=A0AAE8SRR3_9PEZI|nr:uncharacterized protein DNG_01525 [Cephalotrichum gorgonifer]
MGLLSFLKGKNERLRAPLRVQAYHDVTASKPPMMGTYPITGPKPPVRKHVPRRVDNDMPSSPLTDIVPDQHSARPHTRTHVDTYPHLHGSALASPSDPPTARPASSHQRTPWSRKRDSILGPPVSLRNAFAALTPQRSVSSLVQDAPPPAEEAIAFDPSPVVDPLRPLTSYGHARHDSARSRGRVGGAAHVDLLDAQSMVKPADFRGRVAASGARDYGEDVADRNIAMNASLASSPPRPSLSSRRTSSYQNSVSGEKELPLHMRPLVTSPEASNRAFSSHSRHTSAGEGEWERPTSSRGYPREWPASSDAFPPLPQRVDDFRPREPGSVSRARSRGRRSVSNHEWIPPSYPQEGRHSIHGGLVHAASNNDLSIAKSRPTSRSRGNSSDGRTQRPKTSGYHERSISSDLGILPPEMPNMTLAARRQRSFGRMRANSAGPHDPMPRPPSRDSTSGSIPPPIRTWASSRASISDHGRRPPSQDSSYDRQAHKHQENPDWAGASAYGLGRIDVESNTAPSVTSSSPAPSPHIRRGGDRIDSLYSYERARSFAPSAKAGRYRLDEISETVPFRNSSLRHSSMSSTTPTTSSLSSNPFPRPHSRHTAQTSVDTLLHSPALPSGSLSPGNCATDDDVYHREGEPIGSPMTAVIRSPSFNMDDYLSEEEVDGPDGVPGAHPRSPDDESLLFRESEFGFHGPQLPGLFDAIPELPAEDHSSIQLPASSRYDFRGSRRGKHSVDSTYSARSMSLYSERTMHSADFGPLSRIASLTDEEAAPESGEYEDILARARATGDSDRGLSTMDIKRAIRMRKESKARMRMSLRDFGEIE